MKFQNYLVTVNCNNAIRKYIVLCDDAGKAVNLVFEQEHKHENLHDDNDACNPTYEAQAIRHEIYEILSESNIR